MTELAMMVTSDLRALISLPEGSGEIDRPVLCFLHGYDEGPPTGIREGLTRHGPLRPGNPAIVRSFIIIAPQLPGRGDIWPYYADAMVELIQLVQSEHSGDRQRTYLTGFSFGGSGVFDLALRNPEIWAALWPVDPTRVPESDPGLPVWLSSGEVSRRGRSRFISSLALEQPDTGPDLDRIYSDDGLDHVGTATAAYRNQEIYRWLLRRRRVNQ